MLSHCIGYRSEMNPEEKVRWCFYGVIRTFLRIVFVDIAKKKLTINLGYGLWALMTMSATFGQIYAAINNEMHVAANAVSLLLVNIQILTKYFCLREKRGLRNAADFIIEIYRKNGNARGKLTYSIYAKCYS